jgi:transposase InsO family protein
MVAFIDEHRDEYGVEPMCRVLPIAPSTYHEHVHRRAHPEKRPPRVQRDEELKPEVQRVFDENYRVYGVRKVWKQLKREGFPVARCTTRRLMRDLGLRGVVRGRKAPRTTVSDNAPCPADLVQRDFMATAPNRLWVADFTYVRTLKTFVYVAFVVDVFSRHIVGWWASRTMETDMVLNALEHALVDREADGQLVHHSDRGSQYLSIRYTERLAEAGIERSVGSVGDSYDNALAESVIGLFKAEVVDRRDKWASFEDVELATFEWVDWFNNRRLLAPLGYVPPVEYEAAFENGHAAQRMAA